METLKNKILLLRKEKIDYNVIVLTLLCACFNPFLTFLVGSIVVLSINPYKYELRLWGWIGVFFVSLLSMTKVPESDLGWVVDHFHQAGKMSYISYLSLLGKEPLYQSFSYAMHYILANNEKLFIFVLSMTTLSLLYISLYTFCEKVRVNKYIYVTCVFLMLFSPYFFGSPVHLVRQAMAMSLFMFVFVNKICGKRFYWPLALCTPFIHSTAILCLPFLFMGFMKKPISHRSILIYILIGAVFFFIQQIASFLLPYFEGTNNSIAYALGRASHNTTFETKVVIYQIVLICLIGILLLYIVWKKKRKIRYHEEINYFVGFIISVIIFVISATGQAELQMRYSYLIWQYLPLIACVILKSIKVDNTLLSVFWGVLFGCWWLFELYVTPFSYKGIESFWFYTIFNYYLS